MSSNTLHRITDLTSWPILRCFPPEFLSQVRKFYIAYDGWNSGYYLLFVCHDGKVFDSRVRMYPKAPLSVDSLNELSIFHGVPLSNVTFLFPLVIVVTQSGKLYYWEVKLPSRTSRFYNFKTVCTPTLFVENVAQVALIHHWLLILYRDGTLTDGRVLTALDYKDTTICPQSTLNLYTQSRVTSIGLFGNSTIWMGLTHHEDNHITTWRYSSRKGGSIGDPYVTFLDLVPNLTSPITAAALVVSGFLFATSSGGCYLVGRKKGDQPVQLLQIERNDPIDKILSINEYQKSSCAIFISRTGRLFVANLEGMKCVRVVHSTLRSVVDAIGLYWHHPRTVAFATIAPEAIHQDNHQFNNPFVTPKLALHINYHPFNWRSSKRIVFVVPSVLQTRSPYLAEKIQNEMTRNCEMFVDTHRYSVYHSYLRYHHTDSLDHLDPDLALELLQLALTFDETRLAEQCRQFIWKHFSPGDMFRVYSFLSGQTREKNVIDVVSGYLSLDNFARWLKLAHRNKDYLLWKEMARFVRTHFDQVVHHSNYRTMQPTLWRAMMKTAAKLDIN